MARALPPPPDVGSVLRGLRLSRQLTQEQICLRANVSQSYLSLVEAGKKNPSFDYLSTILAVLGVSWGEFGRLLDEAPGHGRR